MEATEEQADAAKALANAIGQLGAELKKEMPIIFPRARTRTGCAGFPSFRESDPNWKYADLFTDRFKLSGPDRAAMRNGNLRSFDEQQRLRPALVATRDAIAEAKCLICLDPECSWFPTRTQGIQDAESEVGRAAEAMLRALYEGANQEARSEAERLSYTRRVGTVRPKRAENLLEKFARFQFQPSNQTSSSETVPLLVTFAFEEATELLDHDGASRCYSFALRHAWLRIDLYDSPLDSIDSVAFERRGGETRDVRLNAKLDLGGGGEYFGRWELTGETALQGKFGYAAVGYAKHHPKDKATLKVATRDIRVRFSGEKELANEAALDVARHWLRLRKVLNDRLPEDAEVDISTQTFDVE